MLYQPSARLPVKLVPTTMATARSTTLPRTTKSRKPAGAQGLSRSGAGRQRQSGSGGAGAAGGMQLIVCLPAHTPLMQPYVLMPIRLAPERSSSVLQAQPVHPATIVLLTAARWSLTLCCNCAESRADEGHRV